VVNNLLLSEPWAVASRAPLSVAFAVTLGQECE
jgi:hypothetical protein